MPLPVVNIFNHILALSHQFQNHFRDLYIVDFIAAAQTICLADFSFLIIASTPLLWSST